MPSKKLNKRTTYVDDDEGVEDDGKERFGNACPLAIGVELALGGMSLRKQRGGLGVREEQFLLGNLLTGGGFGGRMSQVAVFVCLRKFSTRRKEGFKGDFG